MESLKAFLNQKSAGELKNSPDLPGLLAESWLEFTGHDSEGMRADKLGQMEEIKWYPPVLEFTLKQFGGTVKGAVRAEVQRWKLDIERKTASAKCMAYPEIVKNSAPFYVNSIADELARFIIQGERHPALVRSSGGGLQILYGKILPDADRKTLAGHRRRLNNALEKRLALTGWKRRGLWWELASNSP